MKNLYIVFVFLIFILASGNSFSQNVKLKDKVECSFWESKSSCDQKKEMQRMKTRLDKLEREESCKRDAMLTGLRDPLWLDIICRK